MLDKLKKHILAARPWSFSMTIISISAGVLLNSSDVKISWLWAIITCLSVIFFHWGGNLINDYFDNKNGVDDLSAATVKYRIHPIISGLTTPNVVLIEALCFLVLGSLLGFLLAWFRTPHVLWFGVLAWMGAVLYSGGPCGYKYKALGELGVFLMWGPLMVEGAYLVQSGHFSLKVLSISILLGTWVALVLFANNIRDIKNDAKAGFKTLSGFLGWNRSYKIYSLLIYGTYLYCIVLVFFKLSSPWLLIVFLSLPTSYQLIKSFKNGFSDMADAQTAKISLIFGLLVLTSLILQRFVSL